MNSQVLGIATGARLLFVDNLYMCRPAGDPMPEASPEHATSERSPWYRPPPHQPGAFFREHPGVYALSLAGALGTGAYAVIMSRRATPAHVLRWWALAAVTAGQAVGMMLARRQASGWRPLR